MPTNFDNPGETTSPERVGGPSPEAQELAGQIAQLEQQLEAVRAAPSSSFGVGGQTAKDAIISSLKSQLSSARKQQQKLDEREVQDQQSEAAGYLDPQAERDAAQQAAYERSIGMVDPNDLARYGSTYNREIGANELIGTPEGGSAWEGAQSAYDALGPSAFDDLGLSPEQLAAMGESRDYFGALMRGDGRDAVSEAAYAGRTADAEQVRSAATEAALRAEELRGGGSAGSRVLAQQVASQAQVGDMHRAGLDARSLEQQRRDMAAGRYYDTSRGIAQDQFSADATRAGGLDSYGTRVASGQDAFAGAQNAGLDQSQQYYDAITQDAQKYNAGKYTGAADMNTQRDWYTGDLNTDVANRTTTGNAQANANATSTYLQALGLEGGQTLGQGAQDLSREQFKFQQSQAPNSFERALGVASPFVSAGAGLFGQLARDDDDDD